MQGNPEQFETHVLIPHGKEELPGVPRDFNGIRDYSAQHPELEGIVWWHPDGRMAKIKNKDFFRKTPMLRLRRLSPAQRRFIAMTLHANRNLDVETFQRIREQKCRWFITNIMPLLTDAQRHFHLYA